MADVTHVSCVTGTCEMWTGDVKDVDFVTGDVTFEN